MISPDNYIWKDKDIILCFLLCPPHPCSCLFTLDWIYLLKLHWSILLINIRLRWKGSVLATNTRRISISLTALFHPLWDIWRPKLNKLKERVHLKSKFKPEVDNILPCPRLASDWTVHCCRFGCFWTNWLCCVATSATGFQTWEQGLLRQHEVTLVRKCFDVHLLVKTWHSHNLKHRYFF